MNALVWLQNWYALECNGDWEHTYGIDIQTSDNPGWIVKVDLIETEWESLRLKRVQKDLEGPTWLNYEITDGKFIGSCHPTGLIELVEILRSLLTHDHPC